MQFAIVIMAAGKGTRLKSRRPKVLHEVGGKPLIRHVVDAARQIVPPEDPFGYGRVIRKSPDSDEIREIVEQRALTPEAANVREINSGLYSFATKPLFAHIDSLGTNNAQGELYLTDMAAILGKAGEKL